MLGLCKREKGLVISVIAHLEPGVQALFSVDVIHRALFRIHEHLVSMRLSRHQGGSMATSNYGTVV